MAEVFVLYRLRGFIHYKPIKTKRLLRSRLSYESLQGPRGERWLICDDPSLLCLSNIGRGA